MTAKGAGPSDAAAARTARTASAARAARARALRAQVAGITAQSDRIRIDGLRADVARACRIIAHEGLAENVLGHVSVRVAADRFLIRCRGPHERGLLFTESADVHEVVLSGRNGVDTAGVADGWSVPSELPIHSEILRHRPAASAVVHAHPRAVVAAGLAGIDLLPIFGAYNIPAARMAAIGIPVYPRSVLIRTPALGRAVINSMGDAYACTLHGHGVIAVGASITEAVLRALDIDALARMSLAVVGVGGELRPIPAADLAELPDLGRGFNDDARWRHLTARLGHAGLDLPADLSIDRDVPAR